MGVGSSVALRGGSVGVVVSVFPSGRLLVEVVHRGAKAWHRKGDMLVWEAGR